MQPAAAITTDIVLLGAGHAHLEVLRQVAMRPIPGVRLTLIAREANTPYSGMLPGLIRGEYTFDDAHIDCVRLAAAASARLVLAAANGLDLSARQVLFGEHPPVSYDFLSINVGGEPATLDGGGVAVKPIGRFLDRLAALEQRLRAEDRVIVIGGGAGGAELAIALSVRLRGRARIALVSKNPELLARAPHRVRRSVLEALTGYKVELHCGSTATEFSGGKLQLSNGSKLDAAEVLWATGVAGPAFLAASGLACDESGSVLVDRTLRSVSHPAVFAAGDCAALHGSPRPKAGVWSVRAGTVLSGNLRRIVAKEPSAVWRPQRTALAILGLGDGRAVAWRGPWAASGRAVAWWKDRIDRRWMAMYQALQPMPMADDDARCGGCGAKIGPEALAAALAGVVPAARADIPIGMAASDDAAVTLPPTGMAVVQSVDFFRSFLDDPYLFGQVAAAHALSDLYAMGATPWTAMAVATVPFMHGRKMQDDLAAMMAGASAILQADGCALVGGHSGEGAELGLGFSVTGLANPASIWRKSGLRAGDALVLTKPLGTGIVLAAAMRGAARAEWLQATVASMIGSNGLAATLLRSHGVTACTDVTGFGLGGHLGEMLRASGVAADITAGLPALPGVLLLIAQGFASTLAPANLAALDVSTDKGLELLADPQTSGGLLAGVRDGGACVAALRAAGIEATVIGRVIAGPGGRILL